jgi:hypothetical protein
MATTYNTDIQKLYVAYFNRPADTAGLAYWETVVEAANGSTAAVSANFAASAEYKSAYAGMSNADIVGTVYMNLFGRAADDAGKAYWAGLLDAKKVTIDQVVTAVAAGAQGSDATIYANKVTAASAFTNALGTTNAYTTAAAAVAAKAFLTGVTDNASLATTIDPYNLGLSISKVTAAANPFSLETGLSALTTAQTAHTNLLDAYDGKADGKVTKTDLDITTAVATKATAVADIVDANVAAGETGLYASTTNAAIKAAVLAEAQANLAATLAADQKDLGAVNAKIAAVAGLGDAITALSNASDALDSANKADAAAHTDVLVKIASYNVQATAAGKTNITAPAAGAANTYDAAVAAAITAGVITKSSAGVLSLTTGVTEAKNPGVTALLNSLTAEKTADTAVATATSAKATAQGAVDFLDLTTTAQTDIKDIAAAMTLTKLPAGTLPTQSQIVAEQTGLLAVKTAADATAAAAGSTQAQKDAAVAADKAYGDFSNLVNKLAIDDNANPLFDSQDTLTTKVGDDQTAIDDLSTALSDLAKANVSAAQLTAVNSQIKAAQDAFTAKGLMQPVMLETVTTPTATAGADIFVAGTKNATIGGFGQIGSDSLYIGSKFTTLGTDLTKGNDAALEAFVTTDTSGNVVISVEQKAFASSEAAPAADLVQITLTGVTDVTKVHLTNGIITVS